ncbi:MAG: helix-turn-helix transcriptional regulator [Clostridiales bacterium]|nr:helix-turn-helix transcriptional regulator [Clostridiales bacterium]
MHYDCVVLGKIIRDFRKERGLTQEVLSGLAGISRSHLAMIENGKKKANFQTIWSIAEALHVPMSQLVYSLEKQIRMIEGEGKK